MREYFELADSTSTATQGTAITAYANQPTQWLKGIVEAAQKRHYFAQFVKQVDVPTGSRSVVLQRRKNYITTWESSAAEGAAVAYTTFDTLDGQELLPVDENYGIAIPNRSLRVNKVDMIRAAKEEMIYKAGDVVDEAVQTAFEDATESTDVAAGAQLVYGGSKAEDEDLAAGDVITTDLVSDAIYKLKGKTNWVWDHTAGTEAAGATVPVKNPWHNDNDFVLFVGPAQENEFRKDSQFVNAAEYGGNKIIHNGEIGDYLGCKIVVSNNIADTASGGAVFDAGGGTLATDVTRCTLAKPMAAAALAWGQKPRLVVIDYESQLEKRLILEQAYKAATVHTDAICHIDVARK